MEIKLIGSLIVIIGLCIGCSGCSWTGTKSVDVWGLKWENYAGMDARVGFNNVDEVEDKRGIKAPSRSERY
jgi:nitrate reductase beta subunit